MKENKHPDYQEIVFVDSSTGAKFLCGTTLKAEGTDTFEGKEYPAYPISVTSASHPFFTGSQQFVDSEGRIDKFQKRYGGGKKKTAATEEKKEESKS